MRCRMKRSWSRETNRSGKQEDSVETVEYGGYTNQEGSMSEAVLSLGG